MREIDAARTMSKQARNEVKDIETGHSRTIVKKEDHELFQRREDDDVVRDEPRETISDSQQQRMQQLQERDRQFDDQIAGIGRGVEELGVLASRQAEEDETKHHARGFKRARRERPGARQPGQFQDEGHARRRGAVVGQALRGRHVFALFDWVVHHRPSPGLRRVFVTQDMLWLGMWGRLTRGAEGGGLPAGTSHGTAKWTAAPPAASPPLAPSAATRRSPPVAEARSVRHRRPRAYVYAQTVS